MFYSDVTIVINVIVAVALLLSCCCLVLLLLLLMMMMMMMMMMVILLLLYHIIQHRHSVVFIIIIIIIIIIYQTAQDNHIALKEFFSGFPEFSSQGFYITGESYAGVYVPTLAARITDDPDINFKVLNRSSHEWTFHP